MKELAILFGFGIIIVLSIHTNMPKRQKKQIANETLILVADIPPQETKAPLPFFGKRTK